MDAQTLAAGAGLLLIGFLLGRLTAPRERSTVVYRPAGERADRTPGGADDGADAEIEAYLRAGRKIEAVRRYRNAYGTDLKAAKDAVEAVAARLQG